MRPGGAERGEGKTQEAYNSEHGIEPRSILKDVHSPLVAMQNLDLYAPGPGLVMEMAENAEIPLSERIARLEKEMRAAAKALEFEQAAVLRDKLKELQELQIYAG